MVTTAEKTPESTPDKMQNKRPVTLWFAIFAVALGTILFAITYLDVKDPLIAKGLVLLSMIPLTKAGMNAMHNAGRRGQPGSPSRNYLKRMLLVSLAYVGSLFAASTLIERGDPITLLSLAIAVVPGLAVAGYFWAIGRYITEQQDEFLRMLMVRQALIATGLSLSTASVWGFLENFGQVSHLDAFWWPILWFFGIGIGAAANKIQYGTVGEV